MAGDWLDRSSGWWAASRGGSWRVKLSTQQIVDVLSALARKRGDTLSLLQCERIQMEGGWRSLYREVPIEALSIDGPWQCFIRSKALAPALPPSEPRLGVGWPGEFALNGLMLLHHPDPVPKAERTAAVSSIGLMHRVGNDRTARFASTQMPTPCSPP